MSLSMSQGKRGQDKSRKARRGWEEDFTRVFRGLPQGVFSACTLRQRRRLGKRAAIRAFSTVR